MTPSPEQRAALKRLTEEEERLWMLYHHAGVPGDDDPFAIERIGRELDDAREARDNFLLDFARAAFNYQSEGE